MSFTSEFEFIAGSPALCFVDTFGDRGGKGVERLPDANALLDWFRRADLLSRPPAKATPDQLTDARRLREAIYRGGLRAMEDAFPEEADLAIINRAAASPPLRPQLVRGALMHVGENPVEAALSVIAADALQLFASPLRGRISLCPECAMMFVDRSRPGKRRWCSSAQGCGNRAKVRNSRARRAKAGKKALQ